MVDENNKNYNVHLTCSKATRDLILIDCVKDYIKHHPEHIGINITHGFILRQIADYYLNN